MNKKALKEFAIYARNELRSQIALRAQAFGITPKGSQVLVSRTDYVEINNKKYPLTYRKGLQKLLKEIETKGYDNVIEEVAYTWFNRLIAIRFMEVHNYLPSRVRVLSSETKGKVDPDILTEYQYTDLPVNKDQIASLLGNGNRDVAFRNLLIAQCNELSEIMPFLFEKIEDFTELLLPESLLHADSLIIKLGKELYDENFDHVEVIGWLYQFYISEKKDEVFEGIRKNIKITKENIPAATQLFTPHWIVRYLVENSLGHMWLESYPVSDLKKDMKYYVEHAEQEPEVLVNLKELKYSNLSPEKITILDPACGSGHLLVYAFDLLYKIYEERGYPSKEIPAFILEKNLYGIDIDDRAVQLTSFALMMKAREKTKRIFQNVPKLNVISIQESNGVPLEQVADFIGTNDIERAELKGIFQLFIDAKTFGSIIQPKEFNFNLYLKRLEQLREDSEITFENLHIYEQLESIKQIIVQANILSSQYDIVLTNPPYMGPKGMDKKLTKYLKDHYNDTKADLFAVFMERCVNFTKPMGYHGQINQQSWMFLSSYQKIRQILLSSQTILTMAHLGARAFEEIGGEVVQSTCYIMKKVSITNYIAKYYRLIQYTKPSEKEEEFIKRRNEFLFKQEDFYLIPDFPIVYWVKSAMKRLFANSASLGEVYPVKSGIRTGQEAKFIRYWYEPSYNNIKFDSAKYNDIVQSNKKWFPLNKGGEYRKWYGNNYFVINMYNNGEEIIENAGDYRLREGKYYFKEGITWSKISSNKISFRGINSGKIFGDAGSMIFINSNDKEYGFLMAYLSTKIIEQISKIISPTLNFPVTYISLFPFQIKNIDEKIIENINDIALENIRISKDDWDSFETSWDFKKHPFLSYNETNKLEQISKLWGGYKEEQFQRLKKNEEEINKIFIELYGFNEEITPDVPIEDISVRLANPERDSKSFLSYCIGLIMGRYSMDVEGLAYAGGEWDVSKYKTFQPDSDGIIPLTDTEYFEDDVVARFQELLVILFGQDKLAENLRWLAESLTLKANETPVERLRRYFFDEFYADHCKIYQKRPIYWMAESGPKKGFRALFYLHRYTPETLATMRFSYVQNLQEKLRQEQKRLEQDLLNPELTAAMKKRYDKQLSTIKAQQDELIDFDKKLAELANQRIPLDLDDGVVVNYGKLQNILAKIK
jgi:type II restriction/modification system DNA methylase subunit YeeA